MKNIFIVAWAMSLFFSVSVLANDSVVQTAKYRLILTAPSGASESRIVIYEAWVRDKRWQTGKASKPLTGHFKDDRRGHQKLVTWIARKVEIVSITGEVTEDKKLAKPYYLPVTHHGGWDNKTPLAKVIGKHKPLTACHAEFDANRQSAINNMLQQFTSVVNNDLTSTLPKEFQALAPGVQVSTTPL